MPPENSQKPKRATDPVLLCWLLFALGTVTIYVLPILRKLHMFESDPIGARWSLDFSNYWQGAKLTLAGAQQILFEPVQYLAYLRGEFGPGPQPLYWSYPPHLLLFTWPLGYLPYGAALATFLLVTLGLFVASVVVVHRKFASGANLNVTALALIPFVTITVFATQNGFLTAAVTLLALAYMHDRPVLAGLALAILTMKPQLGFLFPLVALLDRNWALLGWATLFTLVLVTLSAFLFGPATWHDFYVNIIPNQKAVMTDWTGIFLYMMPTTFGSLRVLGMNSGLALTLHFVVAVPAGIATWWLLGKVRDPLRRAFVLLAGTLLISPYAFNYDMGALTVAAALVAQTSREPHLRTAAIGIAMIAVFPGLLMHLALSRLPLTPLLLAAGLAAVWHIERKSSAPNAPASEPITDPRS